MKTIYLEIPYRCEPEAYLQVRYRLGDTNKAIEHVVQMRERHKDCWHGIIEAEQNIEEVQYGYEYVRGGKVVRNEWGYTPHIHRLNCINRRYIHCDRWLDSPTGYYMQTALPGLFAPQADRTDGSSINWYNRSVTLSLHIQGLSDGDTPAVAGDADVLGAWEPQNAPAMHCTEQNNWILTFDADGINSGCIQFKIIVRRADGSICWEQGENRRITLSDFEDATSHCYTLDKALFPATPLRLAGTVIPLFSIRSESSWGIGDFGDIKKMVDWLTATGQNVLQLLPVNDTTVNGGSEDSYPYNCISVFALNPIYTDMQSLPRLDSDKRNAFYERKRLELNAKPTVDYAAVHALKTAYLRELFTEHGDDVLASAECVAFTKKQQEWLTPYCLFRFLSMRLPGGIQSNEAYRRYDETTMACAVKEFSDAKTETDYHRFVQFILYSQLSDAHKYANSKRVALKGDIPIGVAPNGVDVWCVPEQFNLEVSAGAPPDAFSANGQNWGFPTYNWEQMGADGYTWWRKRLQYMANFFDAYRIDHILGFFRIWQIPGMSVSGLAGTFSPSMPFTSKEIEEYGLQPVRAVHARARLHKHDVDKIFGTLSGYIMKAFLEKQPEGHYTFKPEFDNLAQLHSLLYSADSPVSYEQKEEVLRLHNEVLFFIDSDGNFTPRISACDTAAYAALTAAERAAYDRLYEDYFYHRHTMFWFEEGMRKLMPVLQSTRMTACGEDLGMIPDCVPWVMKNLQIMSLEIQRMPKIYGQSFARPEEYPYLSVATPSTHDMSTLRGWWREAPSTTQRFCNEVLHIDGKAPAEMSGMIAKSIIKSHLVAPSMLTLIAWQDWLAMDERLRHDNPDEERINIPANRYHVWNYRMHISVEQLLAERGFNDTLRSMIEECGRLV